MATGLRVSELFSSLQGEGPSTGEPAFFVRLAHCNLRCGFCDTKYTWDFERHPYADEVSEWSVESLAERIAAAPEQRLIVTGGEPLLQQAALARLLERVLPDVFVEVETNGTLAPSDELVARVDQWNVSPKLESSGNQLADRRNDAALARFLATGRAWLKVVVESERDCLETERWLAELGWPRQRALLMPEARDRRTLRERAPFVRRAALSRGLGFSTRLHLELWDGRRGA
jgi:7-carboxy-7-deazaguanine synthase